MNNSLKSNHLSQKLAGRNLYLVGMMGSGKSKTGPLLAKNLGYSFIDSDIVLEEATKSSISEIFQEHGQEVFRDLESQVIKEIGKRHSLVVATGGGIVTRSENWGILHQGIVIWLDLDREVLFSRLQNDPTKRPLLETEDPFTVLDNLIRERQRFYSESDLRISIHDEPIDEVALKTLHMLSIKLTDTENPDAQQTIAK